MSAFQIQPLAGVGAVHLGAARAEVLKALGPCSASFRKSPSSLYPTDAWFNNGFQVFYSGAEPTVEYIEISSKSGIEAVLFGCQVFSTKISQLISLIEQHAVLDDTNPVEGFSYIFPSLELSLWRPSVETPDDPFFSTVGIGVHGYYSG